MILPQPPGQYSQVLEIERNRTLELEDRNNRKTDHDVELSRERLILRSPNGDRWHITVDDSGVIAAVAL